jgi:uncharacterized membrane protein YeaQ/YmgE (transglycosylase-associated protein family)
MFQMIGHAIFGLIIGAIAMWIKPTYFHHNWIAALIIGLVGAWLGGVVGRAIGLYSPGRPAGFFLALIGALILLWVYGLVTRSRSTSYTLLTVPAQTSRADRLSAVPRVVLRT